MNKTLVLAVLSLACAGISAPALAHGDVTCNGGPQSGWKPIAELQKDIRKKGWTIRKAKTHRDCYEVYGTNPQGDGVEAFFHPVTFKPVLILKRGKVLYKAPVPATR